MFGVNICLPSPPEPGDQSIIHIKFRTVSTDVESLRPVISLPIEKNSSSPASSSCTSSFIGMKAHIIVIVLHNEIPVMWSSVWGPKKKEESNNNRKNKYKNFIGSMEQSPFYCDCHQQLWLCWGLVYRTIRRYLSVKSSTPFVCC